MEQELEQEVEAEELEEEEVVVEEVASLRAPLVKAVHFPVLLVKATYRVN